MITAHGFWSRRRILLAVVGALLVPCGQGLAAELVDRLVLLSGGVHVMTVGRPAAERVERQGS